MVNIEEECDKFMGMMGCDNWGESQTNSMNSAFYGGALVAFILLQHATESENEDICVTKFNDIYNLINKNILEQKNIMQVLWDKQKP